MFSAVSTSSTSNMQIQLGTGVGPTYATSGYTGAISLGTTNTFITTGIGVTQTTAAATTYSGQIVIQLVDTTNFLWVANGNIAGSVTQGTANIASTIGLGAALTAVRVTTILGTATFDNGYINVLYE